MKPSELLKALLEWNDGKISEFYKCVEGDNELIYHCFGFGEITLKETLLGSYMFPYSHDGYISNAFTNAAGGLFLTYSYYSPFISNTKDIYIQVSSNRYPRRNIQSLNGITASDVESIAKRIYDNCSLYVKRKKQVDVECAKRKRKEELKKFRESIKEESFITKIRNKLSQLLVT